jgi:glycosyltransferase involved in cell wall biosynthesis
VISCLTVTQEGRLGELGRAVRCFDRQTVPDRELVILHDGGDPFHGEVEALVQRFPGSTIRVERATAGLPLGTLRNLSVERARHDIVCQWDDDDLYHPLRLERQLEELTRRKADFCFFTDQLHWFELEGTMYWDDWTRERFPMSLIQGTIMGRRNRLGAYPALRRGEDTSVVIDLVRRGCRVAALQDNGYLYIYTYNGRNAWEREHHVAISAWKRRSGPMVRMLEDELRVALAAYDLPGVTVTMPFEDGPLELPLHR